MILSGRKTWSWFLWRGGDIVSSKAKITPYFCVQQIKKCYMFSVYNSQERGR